MKSLPVTRMPEYREQAVRVSRNSTINVMHNIYSVPAKSKEQTFDGIGLASMIEI